MIDFTATWCGPCQFMAPAIDEFAAKYTDVEFIKIDVDKLAVHSSSSSSSSLSASLSCSYFTCMVIFYLFRLSILTKENNRKWLRSTRLRQCPRLCC